mmetsp:Transcript_10130/g.25372  ORF Transcript_10130/g.25372 Transcript_10130/m.25372 type:complete len:554 (-) Transcript_10130:547-2208(-)|eukprot:CAMPEP_0174889968 /NCGR_PEP_ID=MMETSP0167-20121228/5136_1 /TAXON_ID=38298 /ORGANISM="Rhodella maculata, Strain CCMP736" /LENGTH=553 /DNA_ID=CAMNT_0016127569 /DNA_START=582 /DNA_END=2243 /DNA_ORIENTATION=-
MAQPRKFFDVIIVGGGVAGLAAARHLRSVGRHRVLLLEANPSHLGGRVRTLRLPPGPSDSNRTFPATVFDLGATWVHGKEGNPIYEVVEEEIAGEQEREERLGTPSNPDAIETREIWYSGTEEPSKAAMSSSLAFMALREYMAEASDFEDAVKNAPEESVREFCARRWNEDHGRPFTRDEKADWMCGERLECSISGSPHLGAMDLKTYHEYRELLGGDFPLKTFGMDSVVDRLGNECGWSVKHGVPEGKESAASGDELFQLLMGKEVSKITWSGDILEPGRAMVSCADGSEFCAAVVIVTVSVGVLKHGALFQPPLPAVKQSAIDRMGFGAVAKVLLQFDQPLDGAPLAAFLAWRSCLDEQDRFQSADFQPISGQRYPQELEQKADFLELDENLKWLVPDLYSASSVSKYDLQFWFTGESALKVESLPLEVLAAQLTHVLSRYFSQIRVSPNLDDTAKLPKKRAIYRSSWNTNPFIGGAYSFPAVGARGEDHDTIAAGLTGSSGCHILFAGEVTHRHFYSTMHGAFLSGVREAEAAVSLLTSMAHKRTNPSNC